MLTAAKVYTVVVVCSSRPTQVIAMLQSQPRILVQVCEMCGRCAKGLGVCVGSLGSICLQLSKLILLLMSVASGLPK